MFRLRNAVSKRLRSNQATLTARVDSEVLADMRRRYLTAFQLDDEFFGSQSGCMNKKNNTHPLPWGLVLAFCGIALWLVGLLYATLIGGIYLG